MNQHFRPLSQPFLETVDPQALRKAIDLVATLRARMIRVGLFGTLIYRPDPSGSYTAKDLSRHTEILRSEVALIRKVCQTLTSGSEMPDTAPEISNWIHSIARREPEKLARIKHLSNLSQAVVAAIDTSTVGLGNAINTHMRTARAGFFDLITELCDTLWDEIAAHQAVELERATAAAKALANRLNRLEHIGKHVRLVSLNASVEAARAGDVGKGLMVIAQEFKTLAEEIQTLAKDAHADMDAIS